MDSGSQQRGGVERGGRQAQFTRTRGMRPDPGLAMAQRPGVGARDGGRGMR